MNKQRLRGCCRYALLSYSNEKRRFFYILAAVQNL
jgi:hypothetical protein